MKRTNEKHLRFSDKELAILQEKADAAGMTVCKYIRNAALFGEVKVYDLSALMKFRKAVRPIGTNINQIAAAANSTGFVSQDDVKYLKRTAKEIVTMINEKLSDISPQIFK